MTIPGGGASTYSDDTRLLHMDFTFPYDSGLSAQLANGAENAGAVVHRGGVYGATQGPRLETAAEIDRLERDGCSIVGMTGMPEAILARELEIPYAALCLSVNMAAGRGAGVIEHEDIVQFQQAGRPRMLAAALAVCDAAFAQR